MRPLTAALALGLVNAVTAAVALALVEITTPDRFGWFAYAPLDEVVVDDPRFPWHYVVVPLSLLIANAVIVGACSGRRRAAVIGPAGASAPEAAKPR